MLGNTFQWLIEIRAPMCIKAQIRQRMWKVIGRFKKHMYNGIVVPVPILCANLKKKKKKIQTRSRFFNLNFQQFFEQACSI